MTKFRRFVDDWCYANADCNATAISTGKGTVSTEVVGKLLAAIEREFLPEFLPDEPEQVQEAG